MTLLIEHAISGLPHCNVVEDKDNTQQQVFFGILSLLSPSLPPPLPLPPPPPPLPSPLTLSLPFFDAKRYGTIQYFDIHSNERDARPSQDSSAWRAAFVSWRWRREREEKEGREGRERERGGKGERGETKWAGWEETVGTGGVIISFTWLWIDWQGHTTLHWLSSLQMLPA